MRSLAPLGLMLFVTACQSWYQGDEESTFFVPPVGSTLTLNRAVTIPEDETSVYLQNGKIMSFRDIDKYYPHCKFELWTRPSTPQNVQAGGFVIKRAVQDITVGARSPGRTMLAAVGIGIVIGQGGDGDGSPMQTFATHLYLQSPQQPDVYRMTCQQWAYLSTGEHVTVNEIRHALGEIFTLRLAP